MTDLERARTWLVSQGLETYGTADARWRALAVLRDVHFGGRR